MVESRPELDGVQIVLRGSFNPKILHPSWLAARDLIPEEVVEGTEIDVVSPQLTSFAGEWFSLRVTDDLFSIESTDPSRHLALKDLTLGIFCYLEFTPLTMLGLNRQMHFKVSSDARWHELGDRWAPKERWREVLQGKRDDAAPGLRSLTMEGFREGSEAAHLRVKVEPSLRVRPGIYFETNEHYQLDGESPQDKFRETMRSDWNDAQAAALRIAIHMLGDR